MMPLTQFDDVTVRLFLGCRSDPPKSPPSDPIVTTVRVQLYQIDLPIYVFR